MQTPISYATVSEALDQLRKQGYTTDFNLEENCSAFKTGKLNADDFRIVCIYRYEGDTDPADEAAVFAIESDSGIKGTLVTGYGISSDRIPTELLSKLKMNDK